MNNSEYCLRLRSSLKPEYYYHTTATLPSTTTTWSVVFCEVGVASCLVKKNYQRVPMSEVRCSFLIWANYWVILG